MTDLEEAAALVAKLEDDLAGNAAAIERLTEAKRESALAAARGDAKAGKLLARSNGEIRDLELHAADLGAALEAAKLELAEAGRDERAALDREKADRLERLDEKLTAASGRVDDALLAVKAAFDAREAVAKELWATDPGLHRDLGVRIGRASATRAARFAGLTAYIDLGWRGERHHEGPLAGIGMPENRRVGRKAASFVGSGGGLRWQREKSGSRAYGLTRRVLWIVRQILVRASCCSNALVMMKWKTRG